MAFVYRYVLPWSEEVVYVGRTTGDDISCLAARIFAHASEEKFKELEPAGGYLIEYIDNLSAADSDILETALIAQNERAPALNVSKTNWGSSCFVSLPDFVWKQWTPALGNGNLIEKPRPYKQIIASCNRSSRMEIMTIREYARVNGITEQAVYKKIRKGTVESCIFIVGKREQTMIIIPT